MNLCYDQEDEKNTLGDSLKPESRESLSRNGSPVSAHWGSHNGSQLPGEVDCQWVSLCAPHLSLPSSCGLEFEVSAFF